MKTNHGMNRKAVGLGLLLFVPQLLLADAPPSDKALICAKSIAVWSADGNTQIAEEQTEWVTVPGLDFGQFIRFKKRFAPVYEGSAVVYEIFADIPKDANEVPRDKLVIRVGAMGDKEKPLISDIGARSQLSFSTHEQELFRNVRLHNCQMRAAN